MSWLTPQSASSGSHPCNLRPISNFFSKPQRDAIHAPIAKHLTPSPPLAMAPKAAETTLLHIERISQYVSLSPASLADPHPAICASIFSPLLLSYFPPARGIVLAYEDVELSDRAPAKGSTIQSGHHHQGEGLLLRQVDEYTAPFVWATASLLIFRPERDAQISGVITHQSRTHITLSHLNTFPVSITSEHFPDGWTYHAESANRMSKGWDGRISDEGGWWVDEAGEKVEGVLEGVRIRDFEGRMDGRGKGRGVLRIEGSLVGKKEERARGVQKGGKGKAKAKAKTIGVLKQSGSQGEAIEVE